MVINIKKYILVILIVFISACSLKNNKPEEVVKDYFDSYITLSSNAKKDIDTIILNSNLSKNQRKVYKNILKRQYKSLKYNIISTSYNKDIAVIKVKINVYDLNAAETEAYEYLSLNLKEFYNETSEFDNDLYLNYKLNLMNSIKTRVDYDVELKLTKKDGSWVLNPPDDKTLEKIHGVYSNE